MEVKLLMVGQLQTNCYLVWEKLTQKAIIIDPGDDAEYIIRKINDLGLKPKLILATHGHFDHLLAATELKLSLGLPFLMHRDDLFLFRRSTKSLFYFTGIKADPLLTPDRFVEDKDRIVVGREELKVMKTPGHTPGSLCFYQKGILFSGDTLFFQGTGRTDFNYSSKEKLENSLKKIYKLPLKTIVYPGHGPQTSLDNCFIKLGVVP